MEVYRIVNQRYADGLYASGRPGRWNDADQFVLYCSSSRALATLELMVHQANIRGSVTYRVLVINIPDVSQQILLEDLPTGWRGLGAYAKLQDLGSNWYQRMEDLVLSVPSAVIPKENNFLLNTKHPEFKNRVSFRDAEPYFWDERLE